jgi:single-strand DNA-binding protein
MADINNVVLVGRLTRNAELKYTNTGMPVSKVGIAINRRRKKDNQWIEEVNFFDVVIWGKVAEALNPYLVKGKQIGVQGELRQNKWEQDGQPRSKVEVIANNIQLLGGRTDTQVRETPGTAEQHTELQNTGTSSPDDFEDDIPF